MGRRLAVKSSGAGWFVGKDEMWRQEVAVAEAAAEGEGGEGNEGIEWKGWESPCNKERDVKVRNRRKMWSQVRGKIWE